ncbi:cytochrome c oxidase assembly protein subunit 15 [Prosthecobacter debontii]|uniref:Cytochrome c oxidase assembly protein subunit 15 n=1 Tax=Prosthecobacter debontii TaxID=48467 RepID=A0A1T4YSF3_9BACT|nr:COX15/CtaA family protein [Prosthecobacter debontii]SKB04660.1 cytochrome c oxidase assembly protein subunit 15 [Prosthecobacter debontii]
MTWTRFQRLALIAFITVEVLIFVGAIVRATGSGLGCPDWPKCYGRYIPPTRAEDIDFDHLNLEKFRAKAARHGRDPATITPETLRAEFDPQATWIEYFNRLTSIPVGIATIALLITSFGEKRRGRTRVLIAAIASALLVGINAWLGAKVVFSGLKPGTITLHMALAILLQCVLVYTVWRAHDRPWGLDWKARPYAWLRGIAWALFGLIVIEGIMGSQVRELTDHLAHTHAGHPRHEWVKELEQSWVYLVHRSFSWLIVITGLVFLRLSQRHLRRVGWLEHSILGLILAQMVLGIVLAHVGIVAVAQVLHIGLSSLLVSALFLWLLGATRTNTNASGESPALR